MARLGVNIDHVATVRQARGTIEPDPVWAAALAELGGADGITVHLREDRRHIQERDLRVLKQTVQVKLNLEMAADAIVTAIACDVIPDQVTLVPEKREELTTEGGLDVIGNGMRIKTCLEQLVNLGIEVSMFVDPDPRQIEAAHTMGAKSVELHTGRYADAPTARDQDEEFEAILLASRFAVERGLVLHMGHGLTYRNVQKIARIPCVCELNIGHSIVSRSIMVGFQQAVREMKDLIR
jgi:pyridoxine 5-phosphate synthase